METVYIIGGGPAGTASAMNLLRFGFKPVIIEMETFPRYHIGESLTTECVDALNRLDLGPQLEKLRAPQKQGVRIFSKHPENSFFVGAGAAWQVERAGFDSMMMETAIERGAEWINGRVQTIKRQDDQWWLEIKLQDGSMQNCSSRFVIDASGQHRLTQRQGIWGSLREGGYARQIAFFSQYEGLEKEPDDAYDTLIFHRERHEWCWMIPLSETVTSVGLVLSVEDYKQSKASPEQFLDDRLSHFTAPLVKRIQSANRVCDVKTISNYSYRVENYVSDGLYCVGDSHGFIDPIFSFGVEFAVLEAEYVGKAIHACSKAEPTDWKQHEEQYMQVTSAAQQVIEDMLAYFWDHPWGFANMAHVRHKDEFLELFAGRIYEIQAGEGLTKMRASLA